MPELQTVAATEISSEGYNDITRSNIAAAEGVGEGRLSLPRLEKHIDKVQGLGQRAAHMRLLHAEQKRLKVIAGKAAMDAVYAQWVRDGRPTTQLRTDSALFGLMEVDNGL
jgi:hypothetical protein